MTLRRKITFTVMGIILIFLIVIFVLIYLSFQNVTIEGEIERIEDQGSVIREALASEAGQDVDPSQLLRAYVPTDGMIRVIDENNTAIQTVTRDRDMTIIEPEYTTGQQTEQMNVPEFGRYIRDRKSVV